MAHDVESSLSPLTLPLILSAIGLMKLWTFLSLYEPSAKEIVPFFDRCSLKDSGNVEYREIHRALWNEKAG